MAFDNTRAALSTALHRWVNRASVRLACLLVTLTASAAACSSGPKQPPTGTPDPDRFLFERGTEALNAKRWLTAREYFRRLFDSYPQSRYRADAKLGIGDTYLGEGTSESYVLAANEFHEFLTFYPTHPRAYYAQFKVGMTHYYQMHGPQRDQTETREAIKELTTFVERYSNTPLGEEGKRRLREARDRLSQSEYQVGYFYFRTQKWYPGAIDRFTALLKEDPEFTHRDAVYYYLGESLLKVQRPAEALPYFDRLISEFDQSEFLEAAKKRSAELKEGIPKKG